MHLARTFLSVLAFAAPVLAQDLATSSIQPAEPAYALDHFAVLRRADDGQSLLGGGDDYRAHFTDEGLRFEPALGRGVPEIQHLTLRPSSVRRGAATIFALPSQVPVEQIDHQARYQHAAGVMERYEVRSEGVELSWEFAQPLAGEGDLVIRYAVDTNLPTPAANGDLAFVLPEIGGVQIGGVTGLDARGVRVTGAARYVDGCLELSLPHAFVATATYPLVLDPTIAGVILVSGLLYSESEPDLAYDSRTGNFLVAWLVAYSANSEDVRTRLVAGNGTLLGSTILTNGSGSRPRVVSMTEAGFFGVVYNAEELYLLNTYNVIRLTAVTANGGTVATSVLIASSTTPGAFGDPDIGCEWDVPLYPTPSRGFVVVYKNNTNGVVEANRCYLYPFSGLTFSAAVPLFTDTALGLVHSQPAISRAAGHDGKLLVVARRRSLLPGTSAIVGRTVSTDLSLLGPTFLVHNVGNDAVSVPDVDGYADKWVVAWQQYSGGSTNAAVATAPVMLDASGMPVVGTAVTIGGTSLSQATSPTVGYSPGKTWLGYRQRSVLPSVTYTLRIAGIDSGSSPTPTPPPATATSSRSAAPAARTSSTNS